MIKDKRPFRLLVLEDNPGDWMIVEELLLSQFEQPSLQHVTTFSAAERLFAELEQPFDAVLLDLSLPDMRGEDLIVKTLKLAGDTPVIALTGYTNLDFSIHSIALGVSDYLLKDDLAGSYGETAGPYLYKSIIYSIERKKVTRQLSEVKRIHDAMFFDSHEPRWVIDVEAGSIVQVNSATLQNLGYTENEFLQLPLVHLGLAEEWERLKPVLLGEPATNEKLNQFFRLYKKNKDLVDYDIYVSVVELHGRKLSYVTAIDVTEKLRTEMLVTQAIIKAQEDERFEIGAELHDNVCQQLAHAQMAIGLIRKRHEGRDLELLDQGLQSLTTANEEVRSISHRLAPSFVRDNNLVDSLEMLLETFNIGHVYEIVFNHSKELQEKELSADLRLNIFRIVQEQLRNIQVHTQATLIEVSLIYQDERLTLRIADNGGGMKVSKLKQGIGMANIRRRAELFGGGVEISPDKADGFELLVWLPATFDAPVQHEALH